MEVLAIILLVFLTFLVRLIFLERTYTKHKRTYHAAHEALQHYIVGDLQKEYIYQNRILTHSSIFEELSDIDQARTTERGRLLVQAHDKAYIDYVFIHKSVDDQNLFLSVYDRLSSDEDIEKILRLKKYLK